MLALLAFQFNRAALRRRQKTDLVTKVFAVVGLFAALGFVGGIVWRFIWLMNHS